MGKIFWKAKLLERRRLRKEAGTLKDLTITHRTRIRYTLAVKRFFTWLDDRSCGSSVEEFDSLLCTYLEYLWKQGEGKSWANDVCSGLQHFVPSLRSHLNGSWRLLRAWGKTAIPNRACPMTLSVLQAFLGLALEERDLNDALAYSLCFQGLLRPSEAFSLVPSSIDIDLSLNTAVITLLSSKTITRTGVREQVIIDDSRVLKLISVWKSLNFENHPLILKPHSFRRRLNMRTSALGFPEGFYKPYSLRRGGATLLFKLTQSFDHVAQRGRWQNTRTAKIYICEAQAELATLNFTPSQLSRMYRHAAFFQHFFQLNFV